MVWVRLADDFTDHPKVVAAGPLASWLYVCGLTYANRYLTDGFIPAGQVRRMADVDDSQALAQRLVDNNLWEPVEGGYLIPDWRDYLGESFKRDGQPRVRSAMRRAWEAVAHRIRPVILKRDGYRCQECGSTEHPLHVDHIMPLARGGSNDFENLQCLCKPCNTRKGATWLG